MNYISSQSFHTLTHWQSGQRGGGSVTPSLDIGDKYPHHKLSDYFKNLTSFGCWGIATDDGPAPFPLAWKEPNASVEVEHTGSNYTQKLFATQGERTKKLYGRKKSIYLNDTATTPVGTYYFNVYGLEIQTLEPLQVPYNGQPFNGILYKTTYNASNQSYTVDGGWQFTPDKSYTANVCLPVVRRYYIEWEYVEGDGEPDSRFARCTDTGKVYSGDTRTIFESCFSDVEELDDVPDIGSFAFLQVGHFSGASAFSSAYKYNAICGGGTLDSTEGVIAGQQGETGVAWGLPFVTLDKQYVTSSDTAISDGIQTTYLYTENSGGLICCDFGCLQGVDLQKNGLTSQYIEKTENGHTIYSTILRRCVDLTVQEGFQFFIQDETT